MKYFENIKCTQITYFSKTVCYFKEYTAVIFSSFTQALNRSFILLQDHTILLFATICHELREADSPNIRD